MPPARRRTHSKDRRSGGPRPAPPRGGVPSSRVFGIPLGLALALLLISVVPRVQAHAVLAQSFWTAAALLLAWQAALFLLHRRENARPAIDTVLRPQHYVQAAVQLSVFAYWGWYWRPVYDHAWATGRTARLRLRLRPAARLVAPRALHAGLRTVPDHLQHQPVPLVPRRLVPPAVPDDRGGLPRQGVRALGARRAARAHLQPVGVLARAVLGRPHRDRRPRPSHGARTSPPP